MSTRTLTSSMQAALDAPALQPFFAFEGVFDSGTLRVWSGYGMLPMSGEAWAGAGGLMSLSLIGETAEVRATGISIGLTGMASSVIAAVLGQAKQGRSGTLIFGLLTNSGTIIDTPYTLFKGRLDVPSIQDAGTTCNIAVTYESMLIDLQRPRSRHYTPHDQSQDYPSDRGFDFVASLQDKTINWGGQPAPSTGGGGVPVAAPTPVSNTVGWTSGLEPGS